MEFLFTGSKKSFADAVSFCCNERGKLYEPRDENVWKSVFDHAKLKDIGEFWLGIHDKNEEGSFVYESDNSPIKFNNWNKGEPNDANAKEDCVIVKMAVNGLWNDIPCQGYQKSIVCVKGTLRFG